MRGHAYICTKLAELVINGQNQRILRLYNPWGNEVGNKQRHICST